VIREQSFHHEIFGLKSTEPSKNTQNHHKITAGLRLQCVQSGKQHQLDRSEGEGLCRETCMAQSMSNAAIFRTGFFFFQNAWSWSGVVERLHTFDIQRSED